MKPSTLISIFIILVFTALGIDLIFFNNSELGADVTGGIISIVTGFILAWINHEVTRETQNDTKQE